MHVELQGCCSALGYQEGSVYHCDTGCLETVKELIRFLKREDESCEIRRQLGSAQILQNDLVPILKQCPENRPLWETIIRLMVNLTQPAVLCFQNAVPQDKTQRMYYLEIEADLQAYKEAFADEALFAVLTKKLGELLQLDWERRQEEDRMLIERLLILVRNILHVPPNLAKEKRTEDDASIHDQVLWALHVSGMEDLLLYLASSDDERTLALHVMEIISLMFREQTPEQLAAAGLSMTASEREKEQRELAMVRETEKVKKREAMMKYNSRHSRFGGTFTIANMKSISDRDVIYHHSINSAKDLSFDINKNRTKRPRNRKAITDEDLKRKSTLSIRLFLREFCTQFLVNCYNPLMHTVKDNLVRAKTQENDETYYLWAMRFFMEFQRRHDFRVDTISETVSVTTFHYIHNNLLTYHEMLITNKKEGIMWSKRMHLALRAYHELLCVLNTMDKSKDPALRENAKVIKGNVFYVMEYRDVFIILLKKFDETRQSRAFLRELIEANHLFLRMLEQYSKENTHLVVQHKRKNAKKQIKKVADHQEEPMTQEALEDLWDEVSSDLSAIFQGRGQPLPTDATPFDAASEVDVDQQRMETMGRIQDALRTSRSGEAVALFRAAREMWPARDEFGSPTIAPEEEFMALREVFFADLSRAPTQPEQDEDIQGEEGEDDQEMLEEEMEGGPVYQTSEQEFHFREFIIRFANPHILRAYVTILKTFQSNSVSVNHAVVKMMHRLGYDCHMMGMLYQASLFRVFQQIICSSTARTTQFKELAAFAVHIVRSFFEHAEKNPKLFVELFFYKNIKEAYEVIEGYGTSPAASKKGKVAWTEEQDGELRQLFEQFRDATREEKDGMDAADYIMKYILDSTKSRRQIVRQLVNLNLIGGASELKPDKAVWTAEQDAELRQLFERFQDATPEERDGMDVADYIMKYIQDSTKLRRHIVRQLVRLGFIGSAAELMKKQAPKEWAEEEIEELRELVNRYRDSDRIMDDVFAGLSVRRPKPRIIEKILALGLVADRKQLRNRTKAQKQKRHSRRGQDDDVDPGLEEFPDVSDVEDMALPDNDSGSDMGSVSSSDDGDSDDDTPSYIKRIRRLATKLRAADMSAMVEWLKTTVTDVADERAADGDREPIPLVAVTEEQEEALEHADFRQLLKKLGLQAPDSGQERSWRIPGHIGPAELRYRANALNPTPEGTKPTIRRQDALKALVKRKKQASQDSDGKKGRGIRQADNDSESDVGSVLSSNDDGDSDGDTPLDIKFIRRLATKLRAADMSAMVEWLKTAVNDVADEREVDGDREPIPLVAVTEEQEEALEHADFRQLLKKLGLQAPDSGQERFWRIPGHMGPAELRYRTNALNPTPEASSKGTQPTNRRQDALKALVKRKKKASKDSDGKKGRGMRQSRFRVEENDNADEPVEKDSSPSQQDSIDEDSPPIERDSSPSQHDSRDKDSPPASPVLGKTTSRLKRTLHSDSDDSGAERLVMDESESTSPARQPAKRVRTAHLHQPENTDNMVTLETPDYLASSEKSKTEAAGSFPATLMTVPVDSDDDSDVDDHIPLRRRARQAIDSDSDSS